VIDGRDQGLRAVEPRAEERKIILGIPLKI
jgi:hypothetical protein